MASIAHVGMDVHRGQFRMAVLAEGEQGFVDQCTLERDPRQVLRYLGHWQSRYQLRCYYEAGPLGYTPHRWLTGAGIACQVIAPSKTPRGSGDRVRTDARDARRLAQQGRAGALVAVHVPTPQQEAVRAVVRCRMGQLWDLLSARQRVLSFLGVRGIFWGEGQHWTQKHWQWLWRVGKELTEASPDSWTLQTYLGEVRHREQQLAEAGRQVAELAQLPEWAPMVGRLACFRGIETLAAMMIAVETIDFRRFAGAPHYASYWGLTGSEDSTGRHRRLGGITKCGCEHMRWLWVQIAWHYQYPPAIGVALMKRQQRQPPEVIAHAWKAQRRLYRKFRRLKDKTSSGKAVVAVARELACFVWGAMTM